MIRPGLRWEIIFTLSIVILAASFLIGIVVMSVTKQTILDEKVEGATTLINAFQYTLDSLYYGNDEALKTGANHWQLQRLLKFFTQEKGVESIMVVDLQGEVIASSDPAQVGTTFQDHDLQRLITTPKILDQFPQGRKILFREAHGELSIAAPFFLKNQVVGAVRMVLSLREIQRTVNKSYKFILSYIIFTSIIITLLGSFLLSRLIVRPIQKLVKATESVATGDYSPSVSEGNRNEVGLLSFAFNRMAERIKEHQRELQTQIESLEKLNRDLQQSQKEVLAEEKLALVGELAAGVAHEIGNPLSAILGYISLLQKQANLDQESADYLRRMEEELNRINKTIRELLDFSRLQKVNLTRVDMKRVILNSLSLVALQQNFQSIDLTSHLDENLWPVEGDENQFQQVLLNLLLNAGEAVKEGGSIVVIADQMVWQDGTARALDPSFSLDIFSPVPHFGFGEKEVPLNGVSFPENQPLVRILVADNGEGIEEQNLKNIFDPFFTTREPGKGTGLGLAISNRIVESFGGRIWVRSEVTKGSAFLLTLPAKEKDHE